jgi:UDP-glucuronate 4-epimerase
LIKLIDRVLSSDKLTDNTKSNRVPAKIYNLGGGTPVGLLNFIEALESALEIQAVKEFLPMPAGEMPVTFSDNARLHEAIGCLPRLSLKEGLCRYIAWHYSYYIRDKSKKAAFDVRRSN